MEDFWNSQNTSLSGMQYKTGEISMLGPKMVSLTSPNLAAETHRSLAKNHMAGYPNFEHPPTFDTFIPCSVTAPEGDRSRLIPEVYQILEFDPTVSSNTTIPPSPSTDSKDRQGLITGAIDAESQNLKLMTVRYELLHVILSQEPETHCSIAG
jgi:hypothetical protein